jgi:ribosomal protein S18 acetylase RimI-like enzyme
VVREPLGEWELRYEAEPVDRLRKRANSCLAIGDPGMPFDEAVRPVERFYRSRGRTPMAQVEADTDLEDAFGGAGWRLVPGGDSLFLLGGVSRARRLLGTPGGATAALRVEGPRARGAVLRGGRELGWGQAAVDGDWLGVHGVEVVPTARRRGIASLVVAALLEWGAEQGATTVWLHVETDNAAAIALYGSMGLTVHHGCRYLSPAEA